VYPCQDLNSKGGSTLACQKKSVNYFTLEGEPR